MTRFGAVVLGTSVLAALSGCGGGPSGEGSTERPRADASGTVTFNGEPIPAGSVMFTHLESGVYSNCTIEDGEYENASGDGPVAGKNTASVTGLDGADGKLLWSGPWSQEVTVEGDSFEQNFEVKSDEVKPPVELDPDGE